MSKSRSKMNLLLNANKIPQRLRQYPNWLVWRYESNTRNPNGKRLKVPYYVNGRRRGGNLGSDEDRRHLTTFEEALATVERAHNVGLYDGIGLAILPEQNITIIDLDDCISDDGEYSEFASELLTSGTYVERSPSGRGLRAVFDGAIAPGTKRNFRIYNNERVEVYCGAAYTTFTGRQVSTPHANGVERMTKDLRSVLLRGMKRSETEAEGEEAAPNADSGVGGEVLSMNAAPLPNMTPAQALRVLKALPERWGNSGEGTWFQVAAALHMQFDGSEGGWEVLDAWSRDRSGYDHDSNRARWDAGFSHSRGKQNVLSMRNLVFEARDAGAKFKPETLEAWGLKRAAEDVTARDDVLLPGEVDEATARAWQPIDIAARIAEAPERPPGARALVRDWLYEGTVALFSSNGGGGKSYVALTFCALAATGGHWFERPMESGGVLYLNGEDPIGEIEHRLWGICAAYSISAKAMHGKLDVIDVTSVLHKSLYTAGNEYNKTEFTGSFAQLRRLAESGKYRYIVVDNVAKFYMANENARPMVDEFISGLASLAMEHKLSVILIGHDSKIGANSAPGQAYSGSTAWNNSVRTRWALSSKDGVRTLLVEKNNYGATGHGGTWRWDADASVLRMDTAVGPDTAHSEFEQQELVEGVRDIVIDLYKQGQWTAAGTSRGPLGAITENPWVIDTGLDNRKLRDLLAECVATGMLEIEQYRATNRAEKSRYAPPTSSIV